MKKLVITNGKPAQVVNTKSSMRRVQLAEAMVDSYGMEQGEALRAIDHRLAKGELVNNRGWITGTEGHELVPGCVRPGPAVPSESELVAGQVAPASPTKKTAKKAIRPCLCGCGGTTAGGRFQQGHDAKLRGMFTNGKRAHQGGDGYKFPCGIEQLNWARDQHWWTPEFEEGYVLSIG